MVEIATDLFHLYITFVLVSDHGAMIWCLQIRQLILERNELQKCVTLKDEEILKTESRLQVVLKERTLLASNTASLERDIGDLRKSNDTLKTKVVLKLCVAMVTMFRLFGLFTDNTVAVFIAHSRVHQKIICVIAWKR